MSPHSDRKDSMETNETDKIIASANNLTLEERLDWQLTGNHYPPIDKAFISVAKQAIEYANQGQWDVMLEYPNELRRSVEFTVDNLHLHEFLEDN